MRRTGSPPRAANPPPPAPPPHGEDYPGEAGRGFPHPPPPPLRGIRPMWQDIPEDDWMLLPEQTPAYRAIVELGLTFDALARVRHLPHIPRLIERHPELPIVIDHAAKPDVAGGEIARWREGMAVV